MNMHDTIPTSDQYRAAARDWARTEGHARELEARKDPLLAKWAKEIGVREDGKELSIAAAEREVKSSQRWADYITETTLARASANQARIDMDYLMMVHEEFIEQRSRARWHEEDRRRPA